MNNSIGDDGIIIANAIDAMSPVCVFVCMCVCVNVYLCVCVAVSLLQITDCEQAQRNGKRHTHIVQHCCACTACGCGAMSRALFTLMCVIFVNLKLGTRTSPSQNL